MLGWRRMGVRRHLALVTAACALVVTGWPAGSATASPTPPEIVREADPVEAALEALDGAPDEAVVACSEDSDGLCAARRFAEEPPPAAARGVTGPSAAAATAADPWATRDDAWVPNCVGTGTDGFRVQPVLAYDSSSGPPSEGTLDRIRTAVANADLTFSQSAAATGGMRSVRWATDSGTAGCEVKLITLPISSGLASFDDLIDELDGAGIVDRTDLERPRSLRGNETKVLVWTEGDLDPNASSVCGLGLRWEDDWAGSLDNRNTISSLGAVKEPCWDIDGGGSVPAHELTHTLGAVQGSAPHHTIDGHCTDDHDLMCYGRSTRVVPGCLDPGLEAYLDCNHDDYFNTNPPAGSHLCNRWNVARSPYLFGWDQGLVPIGSLTKFTATGVQGGISLSWGPPTGCPGPSAYVLQAPRVYAGSKVIEADVLGTSLAAAPGTYTVTMAAFRDGTGPSISRTVTVPPLPPAPNRRPRGGIVLSVVDGRNYGMLAWAVDPETAAPVRMRVRIPGVMSREYTWNYRWADMPRFTGEPRTEALLALAQLPPGTHSVCFDALDPQGAGWGNLGCRTHTVK